MEGTYKMNTMNNQSDPPLTDDCELPVAIYVRMSTDHQKYSTENQAKIIRSYADQHNMTVIETFSDSGKSGLNLKGRSGLQELIGRIEDNQTMFQAILVYDVSRWGRFQDADESAYYEYICKRAGISVHYCAEQFDNDGSPVSTIVKSVKRAMAGEYSRELSVKVFAGQCRLIELGYRQGGPPGYGLRRMLIDETGKQKGILAKGQHKSFQTDRVILVPGPEEEIKIVNRIYRLFVDGNKNETEIAQILNNEGIPTDINRLWNNGTIRQVLTNEKYIGNNVFNRTSYKLKKRRVINSPDSWIRADNVYEAIITHKIFEQARRIIEERKCVLSDEEMILLLSELFKKQGYLSGNIINGATNLPSNNSYRHRFGSLLNAYKLAGYQPDKNYRYIQLNSHLRKFHPVILDNIVSHISSLGACAKIISQHGILDVSGEFRISVVIARHYTTSAGNSRWQVQLNASSNVDITIAVRMDTDNQEIKDYYIFPHMDFSNKYIKLAKNNGINLDRYRFNSLDCLFYNSERIPLMEVPQWLQ